MSLGIVLLVIRLMPSRIAERAVRVYVSYHSNVPTLVQLMIWYFGISSLLPYDLQSWLGEHTARRHSRSSASASVRRHISARTFVRACGRSCRRTGGSGARVSGTATSAPCAMCCCRRLSRNALPALVNHTVSLFKNSSLAIAIGAAELTHAVKEVENQSFRTFETFLIATVVYLACSLRSDGNRRDGSANAPKRSEHAERC